jgi:hypothetical protein
VATPKDLRAFWLSQAKSIPDNAPLYAEAMASRIAILIEDIEELERKLASTENKVDR